MRDTPARRATSVNVVRRRPTAATSSAAARKIVLRCDAICHTVQGGRATRMHDEKGADVDVAHREGGAIGGREGGANGGQVPEQRATWHAWGVPPDGHT